MIDSYVGMPYSSNIDVSMRLKRRCYHLFSPLARLTGKQDIKHNNAMPEHEINHGLYQIKRSI